MADEVERSAGRSLRRFTLVAVLLGSLAAWSFVTGFVQLGPGESAVVLRLGVHDRTVSEPGPLLHLPWPIESREIVETSQVHRMESGDVEDATKRDETAIQTSDNNIVYLEYPVLYRYANPFQSLYRVRDVDAPLREAAQAAMREVVGRNTIDGVLSDARGEIQADVIALLQEIVTDYELGLEIDGVDLQEVQPPQSVREAFDDVVKANQDRNRKVNDAEGYANEVVPGARARAAELRAEAQAYREAKVAEATGEAQRFSALLTEYQRAPAITRKRLYLETMEQILPDVEKVIIEPGSAVLPYLPIGTEREARRKGASE